jgi:class 3 adenylate cyclase
MARNDVRTSVRRDGTPSEGSGGKTRGPWLLPRDVSHIETRCATLDQRGLRACSPNVGLHFRLAAHPQCSMEVHRAQAHRDRRSVCFGNSAVSETRKLAAILVADIVGYSRLAGADEDRILARLRTLRSDLIDPILAVHHGRVVKRTGDGSIIEFRSVVDAVRCAIEVQSGLAERNAGLPPEKRIEYRVGIHLGDVVEETDGDLMGDAVNIAARLEGVAPAGCDLSLRASLLAGEIAPRSQGQRSGVDAAQKHR